MQQWLTEHMVAQAQDDSTTIIDSLDMLDLDPAIAESYTDAIARIRRTMR